MIPESMYKSYGQDQLEELFSNFLLSSWSYSKVTSFARNEKAFEMQYIYGMFGKQSATTIAGQAYHHALQFYFSCKKDGREVSLPELEQSAYEYIDEVRPNKWKLQKTTPMVEDCITKANATVTALLKNFFIEKGIYEDDIAEILQVEISLTEFLVVNGVEIPLPANMKIDLVVRTKTGNIAVVDHKSKSVYTDDEEIALSIGTQAITYILGLEQHLQTEVNEVWFVENKYSKNKDGGAQLQKHVVAVDKDTRRLYEALLYEPLKRLIEAVSNPDYTYLINESDNFIDKAELYDFWCKTMISEIEDFNVEDTKKELVAKRIKKIRDASLANVNPSVIRNFKENASKFIQYDLSTTNMTQAEKIVHSLRAFGIVSNVAHEFSGYSCDTFLMEVSAGIKLSSIQSKKLEIANALDVENIRMSSELIVYNKKSYLALEVKKERTGNLYYNPDELNGFKIPLGKDNYGKTIYWDLKNPSTPHAMVCGATGSGKSVSLESTIEYAKEAGVEEIYVFCRKKDFNHLHDHQTVFVYNEIEEIEEQAANLVKEMNSLIQSGREKMIMVIFDEYADAILSARSGKELDIMEMVQTGIYAPKKGFMGIIEPGAPKMALKKTGQHKSLAENLQILLQTGRSSGFRILAATQRASVDVIKGDAKVNFPVRICFRVPTKVDSKVILDEEGAESLAGKGDGLIKSPDYPESTRFQAFYKPATVAA
ncbi:MAG: DNA translocase FtsK [Ferruginibacter sp.]